MVNLGKDAQVRAAGALLAIMLRDGLMTTPRGDATTVLANIRECVPSALPPQPSRPLRQPSSPAAAFRA